MQRKNTAWVLTLLTGLLQVQVGRAESLETETPPAGVPPAPASVLQRMRERDLVRHGELPAPRVEQGVPQPRPAEAAPQLEEVLEAFRTSYAAQGRPSIAVYLNRSLSADVREWSVEGGTLRVGSDTRAKSQSDGSWTRTERDVSEMELEIAGRASDGAGSEQSQRWLWEFEEGLVGPFLRANCRIIDRATILRLEAARSARTGVDYAGLSAKKVEMDALAGHIDLLVEVQILEAPDTPSGYRFRATAKEIQTGRVIANVLSSGGTGPARYEYVGTRSGYERRAIQPGVREVSEGLSVEVMEALVRAWG